MRFLLPFLASALFSAKSIQDTQRNRQGANPQTVSLGYTGNTCLEAGSSKERCNPSRDPARLVTRSQDSLSLEVTPTTDVYNGPDAAAEQGSDVLRGTDQLSVLSTRPHSLQQDTTHGDRSSTSRAKTILRRNNRIRLVHSKTYGCVVPATIAAVRMKEFFDRVAWEAMHHWPNVRDQSALFTVTRGQFQLTISCLGGTMPWPLVASVAQRFSTWASGLFVYTFDAYYMDIGTSVTVAVSLRLLENRLPMPAKRSRSLPKSSNQQDIPFKQHSALSKRTWPLPNSPAPLAMTKFKLYTAMVPTAMMAAKLEDFYNIIALKIETGQFANWAPTKTRVLRLWDFELTFSCDDIDVPWGFVQAFVVDMAEWSSKMFTGFYEAMIRGEGPLTGLLFLVSMRLRDVPRGE